jgi:alpha-ketoglutarate-dependent taurine dioxygenase
MMLEKTYLKPFGTIIQARQPGSSIADIPVHEIVELLESHRLVVLRNFSSLADDKFISFARRFGPLLKWEFGEIFNLRMQEDPANHLFRKGRVEMHWDGAYLQEVPRYSLFQCIDSSSPKGGETIFTDTTRVLDAASPAELEQWRKLQITYRTDKKAHYSGHVTVPLVSRDKHSGALVMRFIEPFNEDNMDINPVEVVVNDMSPDEQEAFLRGVTMRLYADEAMYRHVWHANDFLIYDNNVLLHGRNRLEGNLRRMLKRIHIMEPNGSMNSRAPIFIGARDRDVHV